jgi:hypothetical protein
MRLRFVAVIILAALPLAPLAVQADSTDPASGLSAPSNASQLGPATNSGGTSSSADSGTLQPAGTSPLQSTTNDSNGLTAPTSGDPLQAPASGDDQLKVVMGDADGSTHNVAGESSSPWNWLWWSLAIGVIVAAGSLIFRRRRQLRAAFAGSGRRFAPGPETASAPDPNSDTEPQSQEPTSSQRLRIEIARPAAEVFDFVLDPKNTSKWVSFIKFESTDDWPPHVGTIYTNTDEEGNEREFKLTELKPGESFVMSKLSNTYHVRYTVEQLEGGKSELEYYEWMDEGNLAQPFTGKELEKLKHVMEDSSAAHSAND